MRVAQWFLVAILVLASAPARAQEEERPIRVNVGGGYTTTLNGDARKAIGSGYNLGVGLRVDVLEKLGVQFDFAVHEFGQQTVSIPVALRPSGTGTNKDFFGEARVTVLGLSAVFRPFAGRAGKASPYLLGGGGIYWRPVEVSTPAVGYVNSYCNPWWYVCVPSGWVAIEDLVAVRSTRDYGINVGGGVDLKVGRRAGLYIEARYHYVLGPEILDAGGTSHGKATGQFLPFTIGLRF